MEESKNIEDLMKRVLGLCETYIKLSTWIDDPVNQKSEAFNRRYSMFVDLIEELSIKSVLLSMSDLSSTQSKLFDNTYKKVVAL